MERDKALEMALGQIEKQFGKGSVMRMSETGQVGVAAIPTGALALDLALGIGGLRPLGYEPDRKEFHPHLTLARLKVPDNVSDVLAAIGPEPVGEAFTVDEVVLYQSVLSPKGPTYTALERFPLRGT